MAIHRNFAAKNRMQKQQSALVEAKLKNGKITTTTASKKRDISELSRKLLHSTIGNVKVGILFINMFKFLLTFS